MGKKLTVDDARQSLSAHAAAKGEEIRQKYGPRIGWAQLQQVLQDSACVRYPCEIRFGAEPLRPGEFAYPEPQGEHPRDGFIMYVHPFFANRLEDAVPLILYQLVAVNYGDFASPEDAEAFGAAALGMEREAYYQWVCRLADELATAQGLPAGSTG